MTSRLGIELSRVACRVVELEPGGRGPSWSRASSETRVLSFVSFPPDGVSAAGKLSLLRGRRASVVVWGVQTDHRQIVVNQGSYERMRVEARSRLRDAGLPTDGTLSDIAPVSPRVSGMDRRGVLLVSALRAEVMASLAPLLAAGIRIRSVLTPAAALQSLARQRQAGAASDALEAYVALEETATCIAFVRGGVLLAAHDLPWGFLDELADVATPRDRHDIAVRLADEITAFLAVCRFDGKPLSQVSVCGGLPDLRSMTVSLMERLDVEVDALDSLFGIDASRLPDPAGDLHERVAEMRVAWAVAADARPALDLFRDQRRRATTAYLSRAAVVAGVAAGLGVGWWTQSQWRPADAPAGSVARHEIRPPAPAPRVAPSSRVVPAPVMTSPARLSMANAPMLPPALVARTVVAPAAQVAKAVIPPPPPPLPAPAPDVIVAPAPRVPIVTAATATAAAAPRSVPRPFEPPVLPPPRNPPVERPVAFEPAVPPAAATRGPERAAPQLPSAPAPPHRAVPETALPFEASLGTILFGPDRALAIVDGRIVGIGDEVRGARVLEITSNAVMLRDPQGKLRRLSLSTSR